MKSSLDTRDLRNALGVFATGVTVVTTRDEQNVPRGFTANSFTSVSLQPPLILVCIAKTVGAAPVFSRTGQFAVNILAAGQQPVSSAFGTPGGRKFEEVPYWCGESGSPIIDGVAAWVECATHDIVEQGDHLILIGRVVDYAYTTASPLGYCRGAYVTFGLAQDALNAAQNSEPVRVGAIIEHDGMVYLEPDATNRSVLPTAKRLGTPDDPETLVGRLNAAGVRMVLSFIYAVFDDSEQGVQFIFYRAEAQQPDEKIKDRFVAFDAIPWPKLPDDAIRTMLRRYVTERQENTFGVYIGDHRSGTVRAVSH